ncbi:hypothetical protein CONPUDRAFT_61569 [Coniophora puteana RWD-64-598 SS2]|uniref:P-loop containing nucleoside triphosphate hydrolase protein n=1 Tax=Coniophora puteana (strain RWD-64-598) TaxID=741705 RepID=A0A5M3ME60_CONPW|nr:uncharacterized protein CONPUDRAFT_61569 [Coniophora puteana RWD-64-598 SS2]EIW77518.1 hypothetical protein CONPUDRAFT_61569 [Coniophora puteana RWD-64-598 SS2]
MSSLTGASRGDRDHNTTSSSPDDAVSNTGSGDNVDLSTSEYAVRRRELMGLINDLRNMGAGGLDIHLPSIAVIGAQSAGKSSLVEAVSGINVPRDSGTCTRCPMECTMSSEATEWSCTISLRYDYHADGTPQDRPIVTQFGSPITSRSEVDIWLRRAQTAILNQSVSHEQFYSRSYEELRAWTHPRMLKFSKNAICVLIKDPEATDLSFIDLPGLVQNEDAEVIDLVRGLVEHYVGKDQTIILTTIPMTDDLENQGSAQLAREADPDGDRTIGILTKPDMLGSGAIGQLRRWRDILEGRGENRRLRLGYYCMRFSDDAERSQNLSRSESQRRATEFFETTAPWSQVTDRRRFGVPNFVADVSKLLMKLIQDSLPYIRQQVDELIASTKEEMDLLPKPPSLDARVEVLSRINNFCESFKEAVSGTNAYKDLAQRNRAAYTIFKRSIRGTAPDFRPFERPYEYTDPINIPELREDITWPIDPRVSPMALYDVRKVVKASLAWELPGDVPFEAKAQLIKEFVALWEVHVNTCFTSVCDILQDVVEEFVDTHFSQFRRFEEHMLRHVDDGLRTCVTEAGQAVKAALSLEMSPHFTQDTLTYNTLRRVLLSHYRSQYTHSNRWPRQMAASPVFDSDTPAFVTPVAPDPDDPLVTVKDNELGVMADVRAYFQVAYKRVVDHIPLTIEHALHHALSTRLSSSLLSSVVDVSNFTELAERLVSEDPGIATRRAALQIKMRRLVEIKDRLRAIAY